MTIYDISEKAGVSIATVSRVLNGSSKVSEKTRRKVLDIMEDCRYSPNAFAKGLGSNTTKTVGILCTAPSAAYTAGMIYSLQQALRDAGYDSLIYFTGSDLESRQKYFQLLSSKKVSAVILADADNFDTKAANSTLLAEASPAIPVILLYAFTNTPDTYRLTWETPSPACELTAPFSTSWFTDTTALCKELFRALQLSPSVKNVPPVSR